MTLFVDKLASNEIGGNTRNIRKAEYNLAKFGLNFEKILANTKAISEYSGGMIACGKFILIMKIKRDLTFVDFGFINTEIEFDENFDSFADLLSSNLIGQFHKLREKIKSKPKETLNNVLLSDDDEHFEKMYESYIEYLTGRQKE